MSCSRCGAAVTPAALDHSACAYCGAVIGALRTPLASAGGLAGIDVDDDAPLHLRLARERALLLARTLEAEPRAAAAPAPLPAALRRDVSAGALLGLIALIIGATGVFGFALMLGVGVV